MRIKYVGLSSLTYWYISGSGAAGMFGLTYANI